MPSLIDSLIPVVDSLRSSLYPSVGVRPYKLTRILRTWSGGQVGAGSVTVNSTTRLDPDPEIVFENRRDDLSPAGRIERGKMTAKEISLTYTDEFLRGGALAAGQECYYVLESIQTQAQPTSYWIVDGPPDAKRDECMWVVTFKRYEPAT
jgi:hypothetical protein